MIALSLAVAFLLSGDVAQAQETSDEASKPSPIVSQAEQVIHLLSTGQFDKVEAQYDAAMTAALPQGKLAEGWRSLVQQLGELASVDGARVDQAGEQQIATVFCKFEKIVVDGRIAFDSDGKIAGITFRPHQAPLPPWTPPTYAKPDAFTEQPLIIVNGKYELPGTLTIPKGPGPFPAVVLVHGSGPSDQDETIGGVKAFKDLAWGLSSHGIAVFRYVKRTAKYGTQVSDDPSQLTVNDETISDARAAIALVAKQSKISPDRVFLLGHSLGAYLAPRIATGDAQIAGIVMLGANTQPVERLVLAQLRYLSSLKGVPSEPMQKQISAAEQTVAQIESSDLRQGDRVSFLGTDSPASYWLDLRGYHPTSSAALLKIPMLILQGGRDYQVPMSNFDDWKTALANRQNVTLKTYANLNHLFVAGTGPSSPEEYTQAGNVDEIVITDIAAWINSLHPSTVAPKTAK
jgi:dienelactone hydrolase